MAYKKNNFVPVFLIAITLSFLFACKQSNSNENDTPVANEISDDPLTIDSFSTFPPEIEGCSCYFSNDSTAFKKGKYIYINDYAQTSFLKINGVLTKFTQTEFKEVDKSTTIAKAKSDKYEMTIEVIHGKQSDEETSLQTGTIKLISKKGKSIIKAFYGECGC